MLEEEGKRQKQTIPSSVLANLCKRLKEKIKISLSNIFSFLKKSNEKKTKKKKRKSSFI